MEYSLTIQAETSRQNVFLLVSQPTKRHIPNRRLENAVPGSAIGVVFILLRSVSKKGGSILEFLSDAKTLRRRSGRRSASAPRRTGLCPRRRGWERDVRVSVACSSNGRPPFGISGKAKIVQLF